jgi:hypothetical protein
MGVVRVNLLSVLAGLGLAATGCMHGQHHDYFGTPPIPHNTNAHIQVPPEGAVPREMAKITLPAYVIEAPDQLLIEVVQRVQVPDVDPGRSAPSRAWSGCRCRPSHRRPAGSRCVWTAR